MGTRSLIVKLFAGFCVAAYIPMLFAADAAVTPVVTEYCAGCHNNEKKKGDLDLESVTSDQPAAHPEIWEKVVRRLGARQMPPAEKKRPSEGTYNEVLAQLEKSLD